jgi:hypothetical protein
MGAPMKKLADMSPDEMRAFAEKIKPDLDAVLQQHMGHQAQAQAGGQVKQGIPWLTLSFEAVMAILQIFKQHGIAVPQ